MAVPVDDVKAVGLKLIQFVVAQHILEPRLGRRMLPRLHGDVEALPGPPPGRPTPRTSEMREVIARTPPSALPAPKIVCAGDAHYALVIPVAVEHLLTKSEECRIGYAVVIEKDGR